MADVDPPLPATPDPSGTPDARGAEFEAGAWQPLPPRAQLLFLLVPVVSFALPATVAGLVLGEVLLVDHGLLGARWQAGALALLLAVAAGAWLGRKQYRHTAWMLDAHGLAVRKGRFWQRETRVPATRVQHLDLKRGPLQRRRDLATLVVHTAGTDNSSVTVPNLDAGDAERLRDALGRQIEHDDA
jgi:hypothetical protein